MNDTQLQTIDQLREFLDQTLFWNVVGLEAKLGVFTLRSKAIRLRNSAVSP